jgi:HK97 gp10 family phage protein
MREVTAALYVAGQEIEVYAAHSITEGSVSGKGHVVSAREVRRTLIPAGSTARSRPTSSAPGLVEVSANAPYAAPLEVGTSKMAARPFMRPAANAKREETTKMVALACARSRAAAR